MVPQFQHDVFISYGQKDNLLTPGQPLGWVTVFCQSLERELHRLTKNADGRISVWRDPRLEGNDILEATIVKACNSSAVLVTIITPSFLDSKWCRPVELKTFLRQKGTSHASKVGGRSRIFNIWTQTLNDKDKEILSSDLDLSCLSESIGYKFHKQKAIDGNTWEVPLRPEDGGHVDEEYSVKIKKLALDIYGMLCCLRDLATDGNVLPSSVYTPPPDASSFSPGNPTQLTPSAVFVAAVESDCTEQRNIIVEELIRRGLEVLPRLPLPANPAQRASELSNALQRSRLSVHIFGHHYGPSATANARSLSHLQHDIAASVNVPQMIWMPDPTQIDDVEQVQMLATIESYENPDKVPEILYGGIESLKEAMLEKLGVPALPQVRSLQRQIYVAHPPEDWGLATRISQFLKLNGVARIMFSLPDPSPVKQDKDLRKNLSACDGLLVLYGQDDVARIRSKVTTADTWASRLKKPRLRAKGIIEAPPEGSPPLGLDFADWLFINCRSGCSLVLLDPFIKALR